MKKVFFLATILVVVIAFTSCGKAKKGKLISECCELTQEQLQEQKFLWEGQVFANVVLENGDTVHAAIAETILEEKLAKNDLNVEVIVDGKNNDFYFIEE